MADQDLLYKLAFNYIPNIGAVSVKNLISYCGGIKEVFSASKRQLINTPGIGESRANDFLKADPLKKAEQELKAIEGKDIELIFYLDKKYPARLKNYPDSPLLLYSKGKLELNAPRMVAIVGTRKVTTYGTLECEKIIEGLQEYNCTIVSGLAYGVDTIAHRHAVKCGMPTIGVLGNGMQSIYPAANRDLARKMLNNGGILSEYEMSQKPDRENFPKRNRIIAGMTDVVLIVESARKGGSMISAEYANNYNKDVFAIPGKTTDEFSEGCNHLIKTHKAHLCTSAEDIAYIMRWDKQAESKQLELLIELSPEEQDIIALIKEHPNIGLDSLHYKSTTPLAKLTSILLNLEFKGILKSLPGKKYILSR